MLPQIESITNFLERRPQGDSNASGAPPRRDMYARQRARRVEDAVASNSSRAPVARVVGTVAKRVTVALCALAATWSSLACSSTYAKGNPVGSMFPHVSGKALDGSPVNIPGDLAGEPAVLIVGFEQKSQFDVDRWLLGLHDANVTARVYELPTLPSPAARLFSSRIDSGMRSGIPEEDWHNVVTVYRDGDEVARFLGNTEPFPARAVLLDAAGEVRFLHDRGYSVSALARLRETWRQL